MSLHNPGFREISCFVCACIEGIHLERQNQQTSFVDYTFFDLKKRIILKIYDKSIP